MAAYTGYNIGVRRGGSGTLRRVTRNGGGVGEGSSLGRPNIEKANAEHASHHRENADMLPANRGVMATGGVVTKSAIPVLDGIIPGDPQVLRQIVADMYYYDAITGSYVDQVSNMVYSDFTLTATDNKTIGVVNEAIDSMSIKTTLPVTIRDFLVNGIILGFIQSKDKELLPLRTFAPQEVLLRPNILYGSQPQMRLNNAASDHLTGNVTYGYGVGGYSGPPVGNLDKEVDEATRKIIKGESPLPEDRSIYVPRKMFSYDWQGIPFFTRLIPLWIFEKAMLRGTMSAAERRQGGIIHATMGSDESPVLPEQLQAMATAIYMTNLDPISAILTTRHDVQIQEVAGSSDLWKWNDIADSITAHKLKGIGATEAMLSGEMSWSTIDATMTVFIQMVRILRDYQTRMMLYDKVFPYICATRDLRKSSDAVRNAQERAGVTFGASIGSRRSIHDPLAGVMLHPENGNVRTIDGAQVDIRTLDVPTVHYVNNFRPEGDQNYLAMLQTVTEQFHLPIPLRMIYSASGINIDEIMRHKDEDIKLRDIVTQYGSTIGMGEQQQQQQEMSAHMPEDTVFDFSSGFPRRMNARQRALRDERWNRNAAHAASEQARRHNFHTRAQHDMLHDRAGRRMTWDYRGIDMDFVADPKLLTAKLDA